MQSFPTEAASPPPHLQAPSPANASHVDTSNGLRPVKLDQAILNVMRLNDLRRLVDELGIAGVDRRSRESMAAALRRAPHATPELLLNALSEAQVKKRVTTWESTALGASTH